MNLSHFKKLKEDDRSATLIHPDGHKIQVSKEMLKPKMRSMLAEMPMHMAEGGLVEEEEDLGALPALDPLSPAMPENAPSNFGSGSLQEPGRQPASMGLFDNISSSLHWPGSDSVPVPTPQAQPAVAPPGNADIPGGKAMPMNPPIAAQRQPQSQPQNLMAQQQGSMMSGLKQGFDMERQGVMMEAEGQKKMAQAQASMYGEEAQQLEHINQRYSQDLANINTEIGKMTKDLNDGHIDPSHWWNSKSDGAKAMTVVGLLLGGLGAGLTGKENEASKFIDSQIDKDIEAQKMNLGKKQSLLSALYHQYGNVRDAEVMARAAMKDVYASKIQEAGLKSQSPIIQGRAQQMAGKQRKEMEMMIAPMAMRQATLGGIQGGKVDPAVAIRFLPEHDQKAAREELAEAQKTQAELDQALDAFDKAAAARYNMGEAITGRAGAQLNAPLAGLARRVANAYNQKEVEAFAQQFHPSKTDSDEGLAERRANLVRTFMQGAHFNTLKGYGLEPSMILRPKANPNAKYGKR